MGNEEKKEDEVGRSVRVALEKAAHGMIEKVEKERKASDTLSLVHRIKYLLDEMATLSDVFAELGDRKFPEEHPSYLELWERSNEWTRIYNSVHIDIKDTYGLGEKFDEQFPVFGEVGPYKSQLIKRRRELMAWLRQLFSYLYRKI